MYTKEIFLSPLFADTLIKIVMESCILDIDEHSALRDKKHDGIYCNEC